MNNNNSRGGGRGARGGRGGGRGGRGGAARGGRGGAGAGNGSTISLVTDQPFETLSTEEQDMIKYLHRVSKNSKTSFNAILNTTTPNYEDIQQPQQPPAVVSTAATSSSADEVVATESSSTPVVVASAEDKVSTTTTLVPTPLTASPAVAAVGGFTLPPKRKKRIRDDDDSDDDNNKAVTQPVTNNTPVAASSSSAAPPVVSVVGVAPSPAAPVVVAASSPRPTSMIGKWRSQLQALAPPSLPLAWLPTVSYVQTTHARFLSHRSRIGAMRAESIEAISYFHDFMEKESRRTKDATANTTTQQATIHIGKKRLTASNNHHHKSVSEASGSKYSSDQGDAESGGSDASDCDNIGDGPSRETLLKIRKIYEALMLKNDGNGESRVYALLKSTGSGEGGNPWVSGLSKAQREDIAAAAASIAVRVPFTLAPLGHALVGADAEAEQELTDLQVAEDLVPLIGFLPLQQSLMSMWFHCLSQCIGSINHVNNTATTSSSSSTFSLTPILPLMSMFALVGEGDTNNLLHAVLGVVLNGAAGNIGHLPEVDLVAEEAPVEVVAGTATTTAAEEEEDDDDDDIIRPGKGQLSINHNEKDDADDYKAGDEFVVPVVNPMVGVDSLREHTAAASVNTLVARTWRRSHHHQHSGGAASSSSSSSRVLLAVDTCITSILPTANFDRCGGCVGEVAVVVDDSLSKLLEGVRYVCQLLPLGYNRRSTGNSGTSMSTHGVGGWLYTAFAAVELPLDPQGDMLLQRLYRLTLRAIHAIRSATTDFDAIVSTLQLNSTATTTTTAPNQQHLLIMGGLLSMVWVGNDTSRSLETLSNMPSDKLRSALADASAQVVASLETILIVLCKTFVSHNKDLVPI